VPNNPGVYAQLEFLPTLLIFQQISIAEMRDFQPNFLRSGDLFFYMRAEPSVEEYFPTGLRAFGWFPFVAPNRNPSPALPCLRLCDLLLSLTRFLRSQLAIIKSPVFFFFFSIVSM